MNTRWSTETHYNKLNQSVPMNEDSDFLTDEQLYTKYSQAISEARNHTQTWRNNQERWYQQRMRMKKKKIFPFPSCSNLKMPTDERHIRKKKAKLVNRIFGIRPIVQAVPPPNGNPDKAIKIEKFLDHLIMNVMGLYPKAVIGIDKMLESGFQLFKPYWRIETTRRQEIFNLHDLSLEETAMIFSHGTDPDEIKAEVVKRLDIDMSPLVAEDNEREIERAIVLLYEGEEEIELSVEDVTYNAPDVAVPSNERITVPASSPIDPQRCEMICHDIDISYREFLSRTENGYKNIDKVQSIVSRISDPNFDREQLQNYREGIQRYQHGGHVRIQEVYTWEKLKASDRYPRKCVITMAPDFGVVLRRISLDALDGKWPFARINNELTDDRWFAPRGIPEIITDIVREIDVQKNQRIDSQTSRNAPMFMYRVGIVNPNTRFRPNKGIPVPAGVPFNEAFTMVNNTNLNAEFSYKDEIMQLNAETEELMGEVNFTLQSQINKRQPRTAEEVSQHVQSVSPLGTIEGDQVCHGFSNLFQMIFALWCQHGDENYTFQYFGQENGRYETIKLTKEELQGHLIVVKGTDANTNPQTRMQKAQFIKQTVADPYALQTGLSTPINYYNAQREILREIGVDPDQFVSKPQPPPPPPPPDIKLDMEDLTALERVQYKQKLGIQPDVRGTLEETLRETRKEQAEIRKLENESRPAPVNKRS